MFTGDINYFNEADNIGSLVDALKEVSSVEKDGVDSWMSDYKNWLKDTKCPWVESHLNLTSE